MIQVKRKVEQHHFLHRRVMMMHVWLYMRCFWLSQKLACCDGAQLDCGCAWAHRAHVCVRACVLVIEQQTLWSLKLPSL